MAEQRGSNRNKDSGSNGRRLSAREAVESVRDEFPALLGRPVESVLGVERVDDDDDKDNGGWLVTVQVIELERIPRSTDVLGAYAVQLDKSGELIGYRRRRRYNRSAADED
jgi:Gas vesicle synthesis protein GvpO